MKKLNDLFQELGISKVRLAKYLGVSRQMVYNYLELDDINKWPKEKKLLLYKLLDITEKDNLDDIKITTDYLMAVEGRLNQGVKSSSDMGEYFDFKGLNKESQTLLTDITSLIKEKLTEIPNIEDILLLYKQAAKNTAEFTTKETTLDWFIKKQLEIVDINHLLKIDKHTKT